MSKKTWQNIQIAALIMKQFGGFLCIAGFLLILGTAGASDFGSITLPQIMKQASIGVSLMAAGSLTHGWLGRW